MYKTLVSLFFIFFIFFHQKSYGQNVVNEIKDNADSSLTSEMITEKIFRISASGRIFIITNTNEVMIKGDFISVIFNQDLIFRAMVAKVTKTHVGIKVVKIYNDEIVKKLKLGDIIQIIRGDDSFYKKKEDEIDTVDGKIKSEENLFDDTMLEEDINLQENSKRILKQDNILGLAYASVDGVDVDGSSQRYWQFNGQWAYQIFDNIWAEIGYGQHRITDFPDDGLDTNVYNFTLRIKYTFAGPFYSYIKPYFGLQMIRASDTGDTDAMQEQLDREAKLYEDTERTTPAIGVTFLKRLVPGWFITGNLGSDVISMGFSLEF